MRIWIDCEWAGFRGQVLSMALVAEDGNEFYAEREHRPEDCCEWVRENVLPLMHEQNRYSETGLCRALGRFLNRYPEVHLIADWPEDIARFMDAMTDEPGMLVWRGKLTCEVAKIRSDSKCPHHALHDARALKEAFFAGRISA